MEDVKKEEKTIRWGVFAPMFLFVFSAVILGIFHSEMLIALTKDFFNWSLQSFGWLYQWISIIALILVGVIMISRYGNLRIGGKDAQANMSFGRWFAMALSSGIATGLITYGANEPIIYFGNIYGELNHVPVEPHTHYAAIWALGRSFYNWGFIPYAMYTLSGLIAAYMYFNKKRGLTVSATLEPILGQYAQNKFVANFIDVFSTLAIVLALASGLGTGLTVVATGLKIAYGIHITTTVFVVLGVMTTALFTFSSYLGLDKGFKVLANIKSKVLYFLLMLLFITGPTIYILKTSTAGMAVWLDNFFLWGLDPGDIGGVELTQWWTLFDWAMWIAYAPLMGLFLAMIAYGRTLKEFIIVNWILPSCFALIWFAIWGGTSLYLQESNVLNLVQIIKDNGAVSGLWAFLQHLPFKLGVVIVPLILVLSLFAYAVAANSVTTTIAGMCTKDVPIGEEAPAYQRIIWGTLIGSIAIIMSVFGGGEQGIDGIKFLAACGGFCVLFIFMLQVLSIIKIFFYDKPVE
ncbi:BCCT family transporter [Acinetobacter sichuanensis]|uniref:BCCT family transporter n=1 Tax=Acinetobacter sichuanensis TaxID=2136183 RepID=A0A371YLA1_9GAMM|nr:BCCT family transporter [Acinetobacter sichuanensis]RFC82269.1 BCCT transporter [Acinetobacter sichuanensis]